MTTSCINGRPFFRALSLHPPGDKRIPFVSVNMAGPSTIFRPVIGKVDTGADRTMLTLNTARTLGIMDPADGALEEKAFTLANGQKLLCHTHTISVDLSTLDQTIPRFLVYAGVSDKLVNNLFGREWLTGGMCIAFESEKVHFLFA